MTRFIAFKLLAQNFHLYIRKWPESSYWTIFPALNASAFCGVRPNLTRVYRKHGHLTTNPNILIQYKQSPLSASRHPVYLRRNTNPYPWNRFFATTVGVTVPATTWITKNTTTYYYYLSNHYYEDLWFDKSGRGWLDCSSGAVLIQMLVPAQTTPSYSTRTAFNNYIKRHEGEGPKHIIQLAVAVNWP